MLRERVARFVRTARSWLASRAVTPLRMVAWRPLHGGAGIYVADVDQRRFVFVTAPHVACLLAAYPIPHQHGAEEEVASGRV
jgi:hypothetical protein